VPFLLESFQFHKVDLILRKREGKKTEYKEIQVKYGRLYECGPKWEQKHFDHTSWKFMRPEEFSNFDNLYIAYVLSPESGYKGDIFIFPVKDFNLLLQQAIPSKTAKGLQHRVYFSHCIHDDRWYMRKQAKFEELTEESVVDITQYRRAFDLLD